MRWLAFLASLLLTSSAAALGLGEIEGRAVIGRTLSLTIPILGTGDAAQAACVTLSPEGDDEIPGGIRAKVEGRQVRVSTFRSLNLPVLRFRLRLGCTDPIERSFVVLAEPPAAATTVNRPAAIEAAAVPSAPAQAPAGQRSIVLMSSTSLRMLSRQRYPHDADVRVAFIRQVAAANPELFASEEAAFDQRLPAGTRLLLGAAGQPESARNLPPRKVEPAKPSGPPVTKPVVAAASGSDRPQSAGRGRLIVGSAALPGKGPSTAELNESLDRLIEAMNQQVLVQIALTERIKSIEADLANVKQQVRAEQLRSAQLEAELKVIRATAERSGMIQLVLAILLGGFAGAWALHLISRRRVAAAPVAAIAVPPAPTFTPRLHDRPMPSVFDDMPDKPDLLEELLPPGRRR